MRTMRRVLLWTTLLLVLAVTLLGALLGFDYLRFIDRPLAIADSDQRLEIDRGKSLSAIVERIDRKGLADAPRWYWRVLAHQLGVARSLKAGEYALQAGLTPRGLLQKIARGEVLAYDFTIVPGWSFRELRQALARAPQLEHASAAMGEADLMRRVGLPGIAAEGRFLPETYRYTRGMSDLDLLERAGRAMQRATEQVWAGRAQDLPLTTPDELLTLASIIEKETGRAGERAEIAGVFVRRLRIGMRLQTDPTVIYGVGPGFDGNLTRRHLQTDTPWNTYTRGGLPPTPIAMPGLPALAAAAHPADGKTLYFVSRGDGSHQFSATLAEHNAAVRRWQLGQR